MFLSIKCHSLSENVRALRKEQNMDGRPNKNIWTFSVLLAGQKNGRAADTHLHIKFARPYDYKLFRKRL